MPLELTTAFSPLGLVRSHPHFSRALPSQANQECRVHAQRGNLRKGLDVGQRKEGKVLESEEGGEGSVLGLLIPEKKEGLFITILEFGETC